MTVAGRTITKADFQSGQASRRPTQNSRSDQRTVGFGLVAMIDSQLLPQRQILEYETAMSACQDDQEPSNLDDTDDHGPA